MDDDAQEKAAEIVRFLEAVPSPGMIAYVREALMAERLAERERICAKLEAFTRETIRDVRTEYAFAEMAAAIRAQNDKPIAAVEN